MVRSHFQASEKSDRVLLKCISDSLLHKRRDRSINRGKIPTKLKQYDCSITVAIKVVLLRTVTRCLYLSACQYVRSKASCIP